MLSYFVKWSGVPSSGKTRTEWIGSEGLTLRSMFLVGVIGQNHQIRLGSHGSEKVIKQLFVLIVVIMSPMGSYRNIFAHIA